MNYYCCVPHCYSWLKRNPELSFHTFPKPGKSKVLLETKLGNKEIINRKQAWIKQLKIGKKVSNYMRVCSLHFSDSDFLQKGKMTILKLYKFEVIHCYRNKRTLKILAVPSKNLPHVSEYKKLISGHSSRVTRTSRHIIPSTSVSSSERQELCENVVEEQDDRETEAEALLMLNKPETTFLENVVTPTQRCCCPSEYT
jgi:THAP domain